MSKFVTLVLEPRFKDEYGEYANLPVFNAHGDIVGYTGGEVPETGNPCEFHVMDEEGFPVCNSASDNAKLRESNDMLAKLLGDRAADCYKLREQGARLFGKTLELGTENAKLREMVKDMWLYDYAGKFSSKREDMEHVAMVYQRMRELGIEVDG